MTTIEHKRQQLWSAKIALSELKGCEGTPLYVSTEKELARAEKALPRAGDDDDDDGDDDDESCGCGNADGNEEDEEPAP